MAAVLSAHRPAAWSQPGAADPVPKISRDLSAQTHHGCLRKPAANRQGIEMRDDDPTGDAARAEEPPPYLFAILSTGDLVRWRPSDEDRNATDWMAA